MKIPNKVIIGIAGKMGAGKDSVASALKAHSGFCVMRFADALKAAACIIFNWDIIQLEDLEFKTAVDPFWEESPRRILQRLGTDALRNVMRDDIWVKALERKIQKTDAVRIIIPDVRFPNEADAINNWGGRVIKVVRPGWEVPNSTVAQRQHASETALDSYNNWYGQITNDKDLKSLRNSALALGEAVDNDVSIRI